MRWFLVALVGSGVLAAPTEPGTKQEEHAAASAGASEMAKYINQTKIPYTNELCKQCIDADVAAKVHRASELGLQLRHALASVRHEGTELELHHAQNNCMTVLGAAACKLEEQSRQKYAPGQDRR